VLATYVFTLGHSTAVELSGRHCADTGSASDDLAVDYGVRLFSALLPSSSPSSPSSSPNFHHGRHSDSNSVSRSTLKTIMGLNPHRIASALAHDPFLHALYRPEPPADYHVVVHPLFTARDASVWWSQSWQTALASRWRALALIRKELSRDPIFFHPVVRGFHAGRYTLTIELSVNEEEHAKLNEIWEMVRSISGLNYVSLSSEGGSFVMHIPIAYRRIDPKSGQCCFCCPSRSTLSDITGIGDIPEEDFNVSKDECCMAIGDENSEIQKYIEERLKTLMEGYILPVGTSIRMNKVKMGYFTRQGEMRTPKHWAIHYLLPGGKDEEIPMGALLCLICPIVLSIAYCVIRLRRVPLVVWDVKRR